MLKAVIAMSSDDLCSILRDHLDRIFSVTCCCDGLTALQLLQDLRPEVLVLDLSVPLLDGITMLEQAKEFRPPIILAIIDYDSKYVREVAQDIGIGYIIKLPGDIQALVTRLLDMVNRLNKASRNREEANKQAIQLLLDLDFSTNLDGYLYLQTAIPLYANNPAQRMGKELYSSVATLLGISSITNIERSIRSAISDAWHRRNHSIWNAYFPAEEEAKPPSNKQFISRMAEELKRL